MIVETVIIDVSKLDRSDILFLIDTLNDFYDSFPESYPLEEKNLFENMIKKCTVSFNEGLVQ